MTFFILSFIAGALTVLAPCILPLLPVVLGGAAADTQNRRRPLVIVASLGLSVFAFTFLLKASTALIAIPPDFWSYFSGAIIGLFGLALLFPDTWAAFINKIPGFHGGANTLLAKGYEQKTAWWGDMAIGVALGPIFTTCSPTYFLVLATVLPESALRGALYILAYILGLAVVLLAIARLGQSLIAKLNWAANPKGWFKRALGILFLAVAIFIGTGADKKLQTALLDAGFFDVTKIETALQQILMPEPSDPGDSAPQGAERPGVPYVEIVEPSGFVNSEPFALADLVGKKVILLDFMTYSCINCQRTFPYLNAWYDQYKDQGLEIVGIHTPEFAFEHRIENVQNAAEEFGLEFPLVLDNDYRTWRAWNNRYWPHKFLIDIHGNVVYDHIGEGAYGETEEMIVELLKERAEVLGEEIDNMNRVSDSIVAPTPSRGISPETYFGASRNEFFGNGVSQYRGQRAYTFPENLEPNHFSLSGTWVTDAEYAQPRGTDGALRYPFRAKNIYIVAESDTPTDIEVYIDGAYSHTITVQASMLYSIYEHAAVEEHLLELRFPQGGTRIYAFTFG